MHFDWKPEHVAFRQRVAGFIGAHLPADWERSSGFDAGGDYTIDFARRFCPALARDNLLVPHWPVEYGGAGADIWHHWILNEEMFRVGEPRSYQYMSVNWAGPALIRYGSAAQKAEVLPRIAAGEIFFCQGFSEPNAGSDLAALRTTAEPDGDGYRLNGQKIWTSAASFADYCVLLARTGAGGRGGISAFLMPMDTPGISVRIIKGLQGQRSLHEVFLDNVHLPSTALIGEENGGWTVMTGILHNERIGIPRYMLALDALDRAVAWLAARDRLDPVVLARAAQARATCEAARLQCYKVIDGRAKGAPPSAETSLVRAGLVTADRCLSEFIGDFLIDCVAANDDPLITACYKRTASTGIASGTLEVQLNLIARNHLQLPRGRA